MINTVKDNIYTFFKTAMNAQYPTVFSLSEESGSVGFCEKIFWKKTRDEQPQKPFIILDDISKTKINKRHEVYKKGINYYRRENWEMIVTFGVYTQGTSGDFAQADRNAIEYVEYIESLFNLQSTFDALQNNGIIIEEMNISNIRDLSSFEETNYSYRYEIDVPFKFDIITTASTYGEANAVEIDIKVNNDNNIRIQETINKGD